MNLEETDDTCMGKGKESDPTDASVNTSADTLPTRAFIEKLTLPNSYFVKSFSRKQEERPIVHMFIYVKIIY